MPARVHGRIPDRAEWGAQVSDFEERLLGLDAKLDAVQKLGRAVVAAIGRTRAAVKVGRVADIGRGLGVVSQRLDEVNAAAGALASGWTFDTSAYLADGRFSDDLKKAAAEKGLALFESDGRIYCFPLLLRVDAKESAVKIGRTLERRIRPRELVGLLARAQKRPQRLRELQFLELLYRAWRRLVGATWQGTGSGPVAGLADIHEMLTLLPGTDYPIEEFARDLLLLDRRPDFRTRDGCRFEFPASTLSRGRMKRVVAYDERGQERAYIGIRFVKEG
jgi:hypothetical protein